MTAKLWILLLTFTMLGLSGPVVANSHSKDVRALTKEVSALNDEVARLRKAVESLQAIQPTIATLMPELSEQFHVMHYAGEAEDWAVVDHELLGIKSLIQVIKQVDPEKGAMVEGFMGGNFQKIEAAIEHENLKSFNKALVAIVESCNACHVAVGSPFIKVALDAKDSLSMRHSHNLGRSTKPGEHTHMH